MKKIITLVFLVLFTASLYAQIDSLVNKFSFNADFRFRVEQDWRSQKSDGSFREDRTRFRYRWRAGVTYADSWYSMGFRLRTGNPKKQQDPQLTLGEGFKEFGTLPIGLEKTYFQGRKNNVTFWLGKNTFPFEKNNELFWSDNVYPEGVFINKGLNVQSRLIDSLDFRGGHFIVSAEGRSLSEDAYFQGYQAYISFLSKRFELFPSFYIFRNIVDVPDGNESFLLDYKIMHIGSRFNFKHFSLLHIELDYYYNMQDYRQTVEIPSDLQDQKLGMVASISYGAKKQKGDWIIKGSYALLQRYAAVDFLAQNDWARWDYSSVGSPDGRLTNMKGIEIVAAYMIDSKASLVMKYYLVEQLIPYGITKENNSRIRFDLDVKI